ncbi:MAG: ABC transporter substrate-binding protein, partial [Acidobacteriota bacterium]
AYRAGELDAITNANFSPLVLKLLSPYEDFRKTTHSALNFYEVNAAKAPFTDRRVREALSNAIERDRLTEGEMDGQTRPALNFLPYATATKAKLSQDKDKARDLLDEAGYPDGDGFPVIKLLVNRNDIQQRIARSVARMWKQNLNVDTEVIVKDTAELEKMRKAGEFDLVRRGVVFPTSDEAANFMAIFEIKPAIPSPPSPQDPKPASGPSATDPLPATPEVKAAEPTEPAILTEDDAMYELHAIPLYFPTSYSLVKPYVIGFDMNSLDAVTLSNVTINSDWQPKAR